MAASPSRTIIDLTWLVDSAAKEGADYTPERLIEFWKITGEQDWQLCENNFRGLNPAIINPVPMLLQNWMLPDLLIGTWNVCGKESVKQ